METKARQTYDLIQRKASSNELIQGFSGVLGFPFTVIADVGVIFTHYGPMLNDIRSIYNRAPVTTEAIKPIIEGCKSAILADIIVDKLFGNIPVVGFAANLICAKTMTWRLGLLFGVLSAKGEEVTLDNALKATMTIRSLFPQRSMFTFTTPSIATVEKLLTQFENCDQESFDSNVGKILNSI